MGALNQAEVNAEEDQPVDGHRVQAEKGNAAEGDAVEEVVLPVQADQQRIEGAVPFQSHPLLFTLLKVVMVMKSQYSAAEVEHSSYHYGANDVLD